MTDARPAIGDAYDRLLREYPAELRPYLESNRSRFIWQVREALRLTPPGRAMIDIGAGLSPFAPLCATLGLKATIVDDFADPMYDRSTLAALEIFRRLGVRVVEGNVFEVEIAPISGGYGLVTSMDSMEHWHQSPKQLFRRLYEDMAPGGVFFLGVPNCVNLRKRLTVPLGQGKWSSMADWYESPVFRGHVREPDIGDLQYIARDLALRNVSTKGKNWLGYRSHNPLVRIVTPIVDSILQLRPSLCSDIYVYGTK